MTRREWLTLATLPALAQDESGFAPLSWNIADGPESAFTFENGEVAVHSHASLPCWLRSRSQYENFELRGDFLIKGWTDSGIYLRAPEHGRPTQAGYQIKIFHQKQASPYGIGAIFPVAAPKLVNVQDGWNPFRILMDGPRLQVAINGATVQDLDVTSIPELRHRLTQGYLGIAGASAEARFRNLRVKALPSREQWTSLYEESADYAKNWAISEGKPEVMPYTPVLRLDGAGHIRTLEKYRDFDLQLYARGSAQHNGGVLFRSTGRGERDSKHYEIQLHPVEEAHYPTGSLYGLRRAKYQHVADERWYLFQLRVQGPRCHVRIDGETVMEYDALDRLDPGFIELQAHRRGYWIECKHVRLKAL